IRGHHHRPADQLRVFAQQQLPFRVRAGRLAVGRQLPPGGRGLVDHRLPAAELVLPAGKLLRAARVLAVVDELVCDVEALKPLARLAAGVAVLQAIHGGVGHDASPRSSSLTDVFSRVRASTRLTITAQSSECEPSAAGSWPDTTTQ